MSFILPPEATAAAGAGTQPRDGVVALVAAAVGFVLAATGLLVARRRRRDEAENEAGNEDEDELVPTVPLGVRVFAMESEAPREITASLFEPRSVRDARERMARERKAR